MVLSLGPTRCNSFSSLVSLRVPALSLQRTSARDSSVGNNAYESCIEQQYLLALGINLSHFNDNPLF